MNVPGKPTQHKDGAGAGQPYRGGSIFCNAASSYIHIKHQVTLTSYETIAAKVNFKKLVIEAGVTVMAYHTDNGIYCSSEFLKELHTKGQGIKMSSMHNSKMGLQRM